MAIQVASIDCGLDILSASDVVVTSLDAAASVDPAMHDVAVVDCRSSQPRHGHSEPVHERQLRHLAPLSVVVVAWVDCDDLTGRDFELVDLVATSADLGSASFLWRLRREVDRHRAPCSIAPRWQPERQLLDAIADHTSDWIFVKDLAHRFLVAPVSFAEEIGLPRSALLGCDDLEIGSSEASVLGDPDSNWPGFWAQDDAVVAAGTVQIEDNPDWKLFSRSRRHKRTVRVPLRNARGEVYALLASARDVTRMVKAESAVMRGQNLLDAESRARRAAEKAAREKMSFLAAATHDLRQPLHAMGLFIESLRGRLDCPQQKQTLDKIAQSTSALSALFNALLDITRLDAALVPVEERHFSLSPLIDALRDEFLVEGHVKGLQVSLDTTTEVVFSDPLLLGRILRNLLHNALRYTESGTVRLAIELVDDAVMIRVSDSGPGIPAEEHAAIFGEFYRVQGSSAERGLGLGLAIVRRTAELIGATLQLESTIGEGSTFSVCVPRGERVRANETVKREVVDLEPGSIVLVIDDESAIRHGMHDVFTAQGCEVVVGDNMKTAVEELGRRNVIPDIVIADHQLDRQQSGIGVINAIRKHYQRDIPGVIVTGDTAPERLHEARRSGLAFLHKPAAPAELVRLVAELLN